VGDRAGGFGEEQAFHGLDAVDAAALGGLGESFEIRLGLAAEKREPQTALSFLRTVAGGGVAAELAQDRAHLVEEGGGGVAGVPHRDGDGYPLL
jgi:hypothetical protein